ncbi:MAG: anhydro-N-acetylmuramic acid kinase [Neisseriaceae bacterium]
MIRPEKEYYIGIMSGTSMDGVDVVCASYRQEKFVEVLGHHFVPYPARLKSELLTLQHIQFNELHISQLLAQEITGLYAQAVQKLLDKIRLLPADVCAIGCHGQTIRHRPDKHYSIQIANYALLAELTRIRVVGDFRVTDLAAGGEGAPLVPLFHKELFTVTSHARVILNLGGIANITLLEPNRPVLGFDTGPGNMLLDAWCQEKFSYPFDKNGQYSARGTVIKKLLDKLLATDFFQQPPPKSTGRDLFSLEWLKESVEHEMSAFDVATTLVQLTALTVANSIKQWASSVKEVYVCGGGVYNPTLMEALKVCLTPCPVMSIKLLGVEPMHVEATAFSWLAMRKMHKKPGNAPSCTGARGDRILGAVWDPFH